jgi:hypothetical protein
VNKNRLKKEAAILVTVLIGNGCPLTFIKPSANNSKKQKSTKQDTMKGNIIQGVF